MRLLKLSVHGDALFSGSRLDLDFFASDRVVSTRGVPLEVTRVGAYPSIYTLNLMGIGGVNASGKTTTLKLIMFAINLLQGSFIARGVGSEIAALPAKLGQTFSIEAIFWSEGALYYIKSDLQQVKLADGSGIGVVITDEELRRYTGRSLAKTMLADFGTFASMCELFRTRNGDQAISPEIRQALGDGVSIVRTIASASASYATSRMRVGALNGETLPAPVLRVFDPSIEYMVWDDQSDVYRLKFAGEAERAVSKSAAATMLSAGTLAGVELVRNAIDALRDGGYLIVDEIENNLNKTLVASILNLFASPNTNPNGALLVFTTHYPELLDVLSRKDDLYLLVRGEDGKTRAVKYSDQVKRIENKKSEVVLSNLVRGTNPSYPLVREMREYVKDVVARG